MNEKKLNFFEWFAANEALEGEEPYTDFIEKFCKKYAWNAWSSNSPIHEGDCTTFPGTCNLCCLQDLLAEYKAYRFYKDTEVCENCYRRNPVWFVSNDLWNKYSGNYNFLCPNCFIRLAEHSDFKPTAWQLVPENL